MALKKSDLYGSLWKSCDELRGGMDASQYKDYILTLLFVKYVSDKATSDPDTIPGAIVAEWADAEAHEAFIRGGFGSPQPAVVTVQLTLVEDPS